MNDQELLLAHNVYSNKGTYAVFLGSGVSRSAGIPTGWEIIVRLITRLAILKTGEIPTDPESWYHTYYNRNPNYSYIIEELTATPEERVNLLKPFFEATEEEFADGLKKPTAAHRAIARLVQKGHVRVIVTTNFDRLMENALRELGIEASVISNPIHIGNVMPLIHSPISILKVNGDYLDTKFLNLESELSDYDENLVEQLKFIFENFGLITSGWSAKWDIALRQVLESANKFRFSNYFTYIHRCDDELKELAFKRSGKLLRVENANAFFTELVDNIEALEKGEKNNPLTKQIVLERLRKYIARDELKIPLYELIKLQQDLSYKTIFVADLPNPTNESIKQVIAFRLNQTETLCALLAEGVYWGKPFHHEIWLNVLAKFSYPPRNNSSYIVWSNLAYLPALSLFYTIGVSAIIRRDYHILNQLVSLQIINPYREAERVSVLNNVNTSVVIKKDQLNEAQRTNKLVPVSELMYHFMKPFFFDLLPSEQEFDEVFDNFELIISLKFLELIQKGWFPEGRFIYRRHDPNNVIYTRFKELEANKELHEWVIGKLFNTSDELLKHYKFFNERLKEIGWH